MRMKRLLMISSSLLICLLIICLILINFTTLLPISTKKLTQKGVYTLLISGEVKQAGVIDYAGYEMNVYKDFSTNPCGDCTKQPVSVYAGTNAKDVILSIAKAVKRADDIWEVQSVTSNKIVLIEKKIGSTKKPDNPSAPSGLSISGEYTPAK